MKVEWVRLGDVLSLRQIAVPVSVSRTYRNVGLLNRGRGLFEKPALKGADTSYKNLFQLTGGQVVYSKLFGWEGSVAVVPTSFGGAFVSGEFPSFDVDTGHVSISFLEQYLRSPAFMQTIAEVASGLGQRRQRVSPASFLSLPCPLPSRADQDRIAAHLASLEAQILRQPAELSQAEVAHQAAETSWLQRFSHVPLVDLVDVAPAPKRLEPDEKVAFVPMSAVSSRTGEVDGAQYKLRHEVGNGFRQFSQGDILFARITPSMQNGKCAIFDDPQAQVGYGSSEFHVLRPKRAKSAEWLHGVLRSHWFRSLAASEFTGTAGQQRVPASFLRSVTVPLPKGPAQVAEATSRLHAFQTSMQNLREVNAERDRLRSAILPAARNEIFSAMR